MQHGVFQPVDSPGWCNIVVCDIDILENLKWQTFLLVVIKSKESKNS